MLNLAPCESDWIDAVPTFEQILIVAIIRRSNDECCRVDVQPLKVSTPVPLRVRLPHLENW